MSTLFASDAARRAWTSAWWLLPALGLGVLIAWEIDWGRHLFRVPSTPTLVAPAPVDAAVLPAYRIDGGLVARSETGNRTLFNPTRRPAPALAGEGGGPRRIQAGQFVLVGTTVSGDEKMAFLKEVNGGKGRTVRQGDEINGMKVAIVGADRVKLTAGGEAEELLLQLVKGPKTTVGAAPPVPAVPAAAPAGQAAPLPQAVPPQAVAARPAGAAAGEIAPVARGARRGVTPAAQGSPGSGAPPAGTGAPPAGTGTPPAATGDSAPPAAPPGSWAATFQNMQQQQR
jgi:hypothetical protein